MYKKILKGQKIYVNEDLTPLRSKLFAEAHRCDKVKNATTREGRIIFYLKDTESHRPVVLDTPDDMFKLGYDNVDCHHAFGLDRHTFSYRQA